MSTYNEINEYLKSIIKIQWFLSLCYWYAEISIVSLVIMFKNVHVNGMLNMTPLLENPLSLIETKNISKKTIKYTFDKSNAEKKK